MQDAERLPWPLCFDHHTIACLTDNTSARSHFCFSVFEMRNLDYKFVSKLYGRSPLTCKMPKTHTSPVFTLFKCLRRSPDPQSLFTSDSLAWNVVDFIIIFYLDPLTSCLVLFELMNVLFILSPQHGKKTLLIIFPVTIWPRKILQSRRVWRSQPPCSRPCSVASLYCSWSVDGRWSRRASSTVIEQTCSRERTGMYERDEVRRRFWSFPSESRTRGEKKGER